MSSNSSVPSTIFIDEPAIVPFASGEVLVRLAQIIGALNHEAQSEPLQTAKANLLAAIESGGRGAVGSTLHAAQAELSGLYQTVKEDAEQCARLGFPVAEFVADEYSIAPIIIDSVTATFTITGKQILTSIAFERAANARFYWLHEVRHFPTHNPHQQAAERVEDPVIESSAPFFDRLRLPSGPRVLRIKSRNLSTSVLSEEFTIHVPFLES